MIGHTISKYRITAELGRGGASFVFRATDLDLDRSVAQKFVPLELSRLSDVRRQTDQIGVTVWYQDPR